MSRSATATGRRPRWGVDVAVAAGLTLLGLVSLPAVDRLNDADSRVDAAAVVLILVAGAATAARSWKPVPSLVGTAGATGTYLAIGYPYGPIMFCFALVVYTVARQAPLSRSAPWSVGAALVLGVHVFTNDAALSGLAGVVPASSWVAIPFTVGAARRLIVAAGARERAEADRRLIDAERLRLAQEVHDVVGHGLAAIQMQADIALHVRDARPGQADEALRAISRASAEALTELRATLAQIAPEGDDPDADSRAPTPGLARIDALRERVEAAGVDIELTVTGEPRALPPAVDVAAYRVLQEALTNVVKHSAHPHAEVAIAHHPEEIELTVTNQHLDALPHTDGFGLVGMRRRVTHLDGRLVAGPGKPPGTFRVRARIPT